MSIRRVLSCVIHFLTLLIASFHHVKAQDHPVANMLSLRTNNFWPRHPSFGHAGFVDAYRPVANLSSLWVNDPSSDNYVGSHDMSILVPILLRVSSDSPSGFVCGFYCNYDCKGYLFAVLIFPNSNRTAEDGTPLVDEPKVVWSANRNSLVGVNASLQLTEQGDLVLKEADGTIVWSTNTSDKSVVGFKLTKTGNLVLFDSNNEIVWQSFDHPTDSLVPTQKLVSGQKLVASVSEKDWSQGLVSLDVTSHAVTARVGSNPSTEYFFLRVPYTGNHKMTVNAIILKNEGLFLSSGHRIWYLLPASFIRYMKLEPAGKLSFYEWIDSRWRVFRSPIFDDFDCLYPLRCGKYGVCTDRQCSCPVSSSEENIYFRPINHKEPDLGCSEITPLSCGASHDQSFIELNYTSYWPAMSFIGDASDVESCKQACLKNCSCKAAMFWVKTCTLLTEIFSFMDLSYIKYDSTIFLKVQNLPKKPVAPPPHTDPPSNNTGSREITVLLVSGFAAFFGLFLIVMMTGHSFSLKRINAEEDEEEDYLCQVPGLPTRFSYEILAVATENFSQNLGRGGFGCVFKGILNDGTKVAVKCLNGSAPTWDSFLAEVETIGSIHHLNLIKLIGYCASKLNRMLVYEYMCNGSLDKWLFHGNRELALDWQTRRKIIMDIAKGLTYLHEECQKKILHLDIKPQNILLDQHFNAKVSDFGLSKLMDRDQSQVVTTLRGTLGYLAPEWFNSAITEKADVYSFGVVTLEILCGRKNLDHARPEKDMHLLSLFKVKAEEGRLLDLVDEYSEDMQVHGAEAVEMMRVAAWCLQSGISRRPSMSVVVKVLEGVMAVEDNLDYNFSNPPAQREMEAVGCEEFALASRCHQSC